ncbi:MAG: RNA polymerase sigma factor RpoD/SigA [Candidatus Krumholzibacteria bacterium]|nr:RNA polymerase sigma factor RpoD/SigA [Candidatus Krumholzibacteria bacterium]MDH4336285.1 RNA polymerase sigma factor RpoD/SigA [Candidatus Krumholzibacteria bacterium]MDH5269676.1 RNA polymerase sigma factor RpoD/SigA [Candidatus Krumholzibacteria bacterium]MDH5627652.1 RNA polymerase sigma factor RpoD/SigA [Candidatus Krumholzibacteria bacterium]
MTEREVDERKEKTRRAAQPAGGIRSLDLYLHEINKTPLLTREQERDLARRIHAGDKKALDGLVKANLRFVVSIAKQYANQGLSLEDLINEGNLGLIKAAHRFDEERGFKFISYAVWWIRQAMLQSLAEHSRIVRLPLNRAGTLYRIGKVSRQLDQELGRAPSAEEIAARLNISIEEVEDTMVIANTHVSLDDPYSADKDDTALVDYLTDDAQAAPDEDTYVSALSDDLERALGTLSERERLILSLYFGLGGDEPMTLEDIGKRLSLTRERIRQIKEKAIQRLRHSTRAKFLQGYMEN